MPTPADGPRTVFRSYDGERQREARVLDHPPLGLLGRPGEVEALLRGVAEALGMDLVLLGHVNATRYTALASFSRNPDLVFPEGAVIPIGETYCREEITADEPFVLGDATASPRFRDHPGFTVHGLRSYVGAPLVLSDGTVFGTLCAVDVVPRFPTLAGVEHLVAAATEVSRRVELRLRALAAARDG